MTKSDGEATEATAISASASASAATATDDFNTTEVMDRAFFSFPYEPYDIQIDLMRQLYRTIDARHIGIFESPTGTGKSMSLICGALTWLLKNTDEFGLPLHAQRTATSTSATSTSTTEDKPPTEEPSWLSTYSDRAADRLLHEKRTTAKLALAQIDQIKQQPTQMQSKKRKMAIAYNFHERKHTTRPRTTAIKKKSTPKQENGQELQDQDDQDDDGKHVVDAYDSGADASAAARYSDGEEEDGEAAAHGKYEKDKPTFGVVKIIYCSRTHSQISQFVKEIQKTDFCDKIRVVSLGSRKNLCLNDKVTNLKSDLRMADKCLDMLQGASKSAKNDKKKKTAKCPFYERELIGHYKDYALATVQDIEDLHKLGKEMSICSYYGTRESVPLAQVIAMPYAMLLSKPTRESLGIDLAENIILLDEAHNIVDAITNTYQVCVSNKQLVIARRSLWGYFKKYENRFLGKNVFYIKQVLSLLEALIKCLRPKKNTSSGGGGGGAATPQEGGGGGAEMVTVNDFVFTAGIDHFNMFKIVQYLTQSELPKKLLGFLDLTATQPSPGVGRAPAMEEQGGEDGEDDPLASRHVSPLRNIDALFKALTNASQDGRILLQSHQPSKGQEGEIKFVVLNPGTHFQDIVDNARSIILAGGTMKPVSQVLDQLFSTVPSNKIDLFACGHVIPPENLLGFSLSNGPSQKRLEFTFSNRNDLASLDELGRILINLATIVPNGIVVFFPSYKFEELAVKRWHENTQFDQIMAKKTIFREPKQSDQLGNVLSSYSKASKDGKGAILLSVVGGKMSEGINFSDELARCVVMVGLPYPNARDPELVEKMAFLEKRTKGAGRTYYDSLCMKAVNQSIGRAIRHQNDYSTIVLVDHRYSSHHIRSQLPQWIQKRVQPADLSFGQVYAQLGQFFKAKKTV